MSVIPVDTTVGADVSIHMFGAIHMGMLTLLVFLICSEHLSQFWPCSLHRLLQCKMVNLQVVERGALILQNCPLSFRHILNYYSKIFTAFVSSYVMPKYLLFML